MKPAFLLAITASILSAQFGQIRTIRRKLIRRAKIRAAIHPEVRLTGAVARDELPGRSSRLAIRKWSAAWCEKWMPIRSNWKPKTRAS